MPTGYTHPVVEGKQTELKDFVLSCCRAFGACIDMRDDSNETPIPEEFKPSDYHAKAIEASQVEYERLRNMDPDAALVFGESLKQEAIASALKAVESRRIEDRRLVAMIEKVNAWTPPTDEHVSLKDFMLQQLESSRNSGEYWEQQVEKCQSTSAFEYYQSALTSAKSGITRHAEEYAKDVSRAQDRTNWMKAVRASLQPATT